MKVTLKTATVKAVISDRPGIKKTKLERLKEKWENQKPLNVASPHPVVNPRQIRKNELEKSVLYIKSLHK